MPPISRRTFLAASASIVIAACSDDAKDAADTTTTAAADTTLDTDIAPSTDAPTTTGAPTTTSAPTTTALPSTTNELPAVDFESDPFSLGVASGDPDETSVVLWTRLAPDPLAGGGMPDKHVDVQWELATDEDFADVVATQYATARADHAHSVHAVAEPGADAGPGPFFYRFRVGDYTSAVGRTRLAPSGQVDSANFVSASCQDYEDGFYIAHRDIAERSPDFVVWLGDYIYEGGGEATVGEGKARTHATPEPKDLDAYRNRYALYKSDEHLQAAHAACPWFVIWDDHEVENNYAADTPQDTAGLAGFADRRRAAYQAWWEHQPVRLDPPPATGEYRIYRGIRWGDLIGMMLLDGRQYRTDQACNDVILSTDPPCPETFDDARTMIGGEQEQWLFDMIGTQGTTWNVIGQQTVMADITLNGAVLNYDQWDGYPKDRDRILQHLADNPVPNVVVLTGDIHAAGVAVLRAGDRGTGTPVAVEFVDTSISSGAIAPGGVKDLILAFPSIVDIELDHRGYTHHTVTPDTWTAEYRIVTDALDEASTVTTYKTFLVDAGTVDARVI